MNQNKRPNSVQATPKPIKEARRIRLWSSRHMIAPKLAKRPPKHNEIKIRSEPKQKTELSASHAQTDQRGTQNSPLVVETHDRPKTREETAEAQRDKDPIGTKTKDRTQCKPRPNRSKRHAEFASGRRDT